MKDGTTLSFDLEGVEDLQAWRDLCRSPAAITGLSLIVDAHQYALPLPQRFTSLRVLAEPVAHRDGSGKIVADSIVVYADDIKAEVLVYRGCRPRMARFKVERTGRPVFLPTVDG